MREQQGMISISTSTFVKAAGIVLALWFLWFIRDVIAIFLIALLLSSAIYPFANWLASKNIPRGIAVLIVYTLLATVVSIIVVALIPAIQLQYSQLSTITNEYFQQVLIGYSDFVAFTDKHGFSQQLEEGITVFQSLIPSSADSIFTTVRGAIGSIAAVVIVLVLTFYMVVEEKQMSRYFHSLTPAEYRPYLSQLTLKLRRKIGEWLRAQFFLGLIVGTVVYIGLTLLGVPYALLLGIIAGFLEIVPYVGPVLSVIPAAIIALSQSTWLTVAVIILYILIQQIENHILIPKIMQKVTGINPIISIAALLIGLKVGGFVGAIFAIPLAILIVVILQDLFTDVV